MLTDLGPVRLRELEIFLEVARALSIREAARRAQLTPGQVSKSIGMLERRLSVKLFRRSTTGVLLSNQGRDLKAIVEDLISQGERIETLISEKSKKERSPTLAIAGTSFMNTHLIAPSICANSESWSEYRFRFLDVAPDQLVPIGLRGGFELAVHAGQPGWPKTWSSKSLGKMHWVLCARMDHPLQKRAKLKEILEYPFVTPTYWTQEGLIKGNDQFPVPISKRRPGFETSTADAAIPILLRTDQLAFLPEVLARSALNAKLIKKIQYDEIKNVEKEILITAKSDSVSARAFERLQQQLASYL